MEWGQMGAWLNISDILKEESVVRVKHFLFLLLLKRIKEELTFFS